MSDCVRGMLTTYFIGMSLGIVFGWKVIPKKPAPTEPPSTADEARREAK